MTLPIASTANESAPQPRQNRRQSARIKVVLPMQVTGYDAQTGKWIEISNSIDVSTHGIKFPLCRAVSPGLILYLSFPMPWRLRQFAHSEPTYKIYALVRRIGPLVQGRRDVSVEFIGQTPPSSYLEQPWKIYHTIHWNGAERRRSVRKNTARIVWIEYYSESGELVELEQGCTENISREGARIFIHAPPANFSSVKIVMPDKNFKSPAKVTNRFLGKDGIQRICVELLGNQWPE
jgi:hypothetical protein